MSNSELIVGLDIGHGENTWEVKHGKGVITKLTPEGRMEEHWFNSEVTIHAKEILERHGIKVVMAQKPYKNDVPLSTRTNFYNAQKCDLVVSNHANSAKASVQGIGIFYWHTSKGGKKLSELILKHSKALPVKQYGKGLFPSVPHTWTDFHMCREPHMESVLVEWAFMTNTEDLKLLLDDDFRKQCGEVEAKAILEYLGIDFKPTSTKTTQPVVKQPESTPEKPESVLGTVKVLVDDLWYYNKPDWDAKKGKVHKNDVFTVVQILTVNGYKMYKLKSGTYLTGSKKYVKFTKK